MTLDCALEMRLNLLELQDALIHCLEEISNQNEQQARQKAKERSPWLSATECFDETPTEKDRKVKRGYSQGRGLPSVFERRGRVTMPISGYIKRLSSCMLCSPSVFVATLLLLDRIQELNFPQLVVKNSNVHRLTLAAVVIAVKFMDDVYYKNSYYAKVGGITLQELNEIEYSFLALIKFDAYIAPSLFMTYLDKLHAFMQV